MTKMKLKLQLDNYRPVIHPRHLSGSGFMFTDNLLHLPTYYLRSKITIAPDYTLCFLSYDIPGMYREQSQPKVLLLL